MATGHIEKRYKNSWTLVADLGEDPITKERQRFFKSIKGSEKEAEKELRRWLGELERGNYVEPSKLTFGEFLKMWIEDYGRVRLAPTTFRNYNRVIKRAIGKIGAIPMDKLRPMHLQNFYRQLIEEGRQDGKGQLGVASITYYHRVIHKALDSALKQQLVLNNIADAVELPKPTQEIDEDELDSVKVLNSDEVDKMLEEAKATSHYALLFLAVRTGLRRGELLGLRWKDLDLKAKSLSVRQSLAYTPEKGIFFKPPKNKKSRRTIKITNEVVDVLKQVRRKQAEAKLFYGQEYEDKDLVFCQPNGLPMHPDTPSKWFPKFLSRLIYHEACRKKIKKPDFCPHCEEKLYEDEVVRLPVLNFHCLRHTHASLLLKAGVDIKIISTRLGHSSIRITYDIYSHLMPGMEDDALDRLESMLKNN